MTDAPQRAYSYLRFSTNEQRDGDSSRRQLKLARAYAENHGLILDDELAIRDEGVSAFRGRNSSADGALGKFLERIHSGDVERGSYLLVENLDRLSRQMARRAVRVLESICDAGVTVVTLNDGRKYTADALDEDPWAFIGLVLGFTRAHDESRVKSKRIRELWDGKRARATQRQAMTATCPGWLKLNRKTRKYSAVTERAEIVRRVFREALAGAGLASITQGLNRDAVPVFGRSQHWHQSYILRLLRNRAVIGEFTPHVSEHVDGKLVRKPLAPIPGYYPRVISDEEFERVQALRMDTYSAVRGRHARAPVQNLFAGLIRCAACGASMALSSKGGRNRQWRAYSCSRARVGAGCRYASVTYQRLETAFYTDIDALCLGAPAGAEGAEIDSTIDRLDAQMLAVSDALETLLDNAQHHRSPALEERIRKVEAEQDSLKAQLAVLHAKRVQKAGRLVQRKLDDLREAVHSDERNVALINSLLRQTLSSISVSPEGGTATFAWKHGGESELVFAFPGTLGNRKRRARSAAATTPALPAPTARL